MQNLGVKTAESYDERGGSRFHALAPWSFIKNQFPKWYIQYDSHGATHVSNLCGQVFRIHYRPNRLTVKLSYP